MNSSLKLAIGSLAVSVAVLAVKYVAYLLTGSIALYSDALESIINVATAIAAIVALRVSAQPADANHPYGHSKAEYFSAVLEGALIIVAALIILQEAYFGILSPKPLAVPFEGLAVSTLGTMLNAVWSFVLIRRGRQEKSPALAADGRHLLTDVVTSIGVIIGVLLVVWTGKPILDPIVAALVALQVLWSGWNVMKDSVGGLMDVAVPDTTLNAIRETISANADGAIEAHDIKTRQAGTATFIDFHLVVDGSTSVAEAHDICDRLESALKAKIKGAAVSIHVEPENKAKHSGIVVV